MQFRVTARTVETHISRIFLKLGLECSFNRRLRMDSYGESAPAGVLFKHFHFTAENVAATVRAAIAHR